MLSIESVRRELLGYRLKLLALSDRYAAGERGGVSNDAQTQADELTCLLEEAPRSERQAVDYLLDRYEALRASCAS